MSVVPGQALIDNSTFCLKWMKCVLAEGGLRLKGTLVDLFQPLIALSNVNY